MKRQSIICALSLYWIGMLSVPTNSFAGDKEWATAGKILAGVFAFNAVNDALVYPKYEVVRSRNYCSTNQYNGKRNRRYYKNDYRYEQKINRRRYRNEYRKSRRIHWRKNNYKCKDPIIVSVNQCRRIFQPRIKGATAYLQEYDQRCNEWVTIEEYPSIW